MESSASSPRVRIDIASASLSLSLSFRGETWKRRRGSGGEEGRRRARYLITRCVLTPAGPCAKRRLLLELPLLAAHRADVAGLLGVQPLHDAVYVETMRALPPHWNNKSRRSRVKLISSSDLVAHETRTWRWGRARRTDGRADIRTRVRLPRTRIDTRG